MANMRTGSSTSMGGSTSTGFDSSALRGSDNRSTRSASSDSGGGGRSTWTGDGYNDMQNTTRGTDLTREDMSDGAIPGMNDNLSTSGCSMCGTDRQPQSAGENDNKPSACGQGNGATSGNVAGGNNNKPRACGQGNGAGGSNSASSNNDTGGDEGKEIIKLILQLLMAIIPAILQSLGGEQGQQGASSCGGGDDAKPPKLPSQAGMMDAGAIPGGAGAIGSLLQ